MPELHPGEPREDARERFARAHDIPDELCFQSWEELMDRQQLAPVLVNSSSDAVHFPSTMAALESGYDVLLEKPIATTLADCVRLVQTASRLGCGVWDLSYHALLRSSSARYTGWCSRDAWATWWS